MAELLPLLVLAFVAGMLIGSFLNVCIYRIPRDLSVVRPRSFCPQCGLPIAWYQNIPVLSYLWLRGRCARCAKAISIRYPLVELVTGVVFVLVTWRVGVDWALLKWILFAALMIVLFTTDLEEMLLPDEFTLGGSIAGLLLACFVAVPGVFGELILPDQSARTQSIANAVLGAVILALPIWAVGALWGKVRGREALGLGDVKLLVLMGVFLGPENGIFALTLGAVAGAIYGVGAIAITRRSARNYELPFGSFLCFAAVVVLLIRTRPGSFLGVP